MEALIQLGRELQYMAAEVMTLSLPVALSDLDCIGFDMILLIRNFLFVL